MHVRCRATDIVAEWTLGVLLCSFFLQGIGAAPSSMAEPLGTILQGERVIATATEIRAALSSSDPAEADPRAAEIVAFYEGRNYSPAWSGSQEASERADNVATALRHSYQQGLRNEDYAISTLSIEPSAVTYADAARFDILMTSSLLRYAHDVRTGRVDPSRIYPDVGLIPQPYDAVRALSWAVRHNSVQEYLAELPPTHRGYIGLVSALARIGGDGRHHRFSAYRVQQIAANMERWRWLPRSLESRYIVVDVPDQTVEYMRDGTSIFKSRVIIGRPNSPTPILRTSIEAVVANPSWDIPDDIAARMIGPHLKRNPDYLTARNIVFENGQYRQNPGPENGLGLVMLDMPNPFWVYLHDTPNKKLFEADMREVSNGCVRVQEIFSLASLALADDPAAGLGQLQQAIESGETQRLSLSSPLPVYMLYWTARADENGNVEFHPDRYRRDPPLIAALGFRSNSHASKNESAPSVMPIPRPNATLATEQISLHMPKKQHHGANAGSNGRLTGTPRKYRDTVEHRLR
jgi:murein L,D-transpeptidase YcbB/YkuD